MNIEKHLKDLRSEGLTIIKNGYSKRDCDQIKKKLDKIIDKLAKKKLYGAHRDFQTIINPFRHDISLLKLIHHKKVDKILKKALDPDYVLITATVINRKIRMDLPKSVKNFGDVWHTDSRYLDNKRISSGFSFFVIAMFDTFSKVNSCTQYVPRSHKKTTIPEGNKNYKHKILSGEQGTIVIMDTGLWHKAGKESQQDRWSMFNMYAGWFMKPYFRFWEMFTNKQALSLKKNYKKLFHFNSIPPRNEEERLGTLEKKLI